jgi:non-specific serine/threonine protein kinase
LLATNLAYSGQDAEEAVRHLQIAVALRPHEANTLYNAACTYGVLGKKADALGTLRQAFVAGFGNRDWASKDSDLDCLHDDPEFQKLVGLDKRPAS